MVTAALPSCTPDELAWEAEQYAAFDIDEVLWDHEILNHGGPEGAVRFRFVKKDKIAGFADVLRQTGSSLGFWGLHPFALQSCYQANYEIDLRAVSEELATKLSNLCQATSGQAIELLLLSGGAAKTPGLREALGKRLDVDVAMLEPFRRIRVVDPKLPTGELGAAAAVAVGLAARRLESGAN